MTGPIKTVVTPSPRYHPYEMFSVDEDEQMDVEAGPSTPAPTRKPRWTSETTGDAENALPTEEEVPVSHFYRSRILHVAERSFGVRFPGSPRWRAVHGNPARADKRHGPTQKRYVSGSRYTRTSGGPPPSTKLSPVTTMSFRTNEALTRFVVI
jgi:hypothetical protein